MIVLFNKPFNVLSQFTDNKNIIVSRGNLSDYIDVPNVYPAGRLDKDSEGLLILTDQGKLQQKISDPKYKMTKTYWVQIEGNIACLLYTSPSPRDATLSRMPSSA